MILGRYVVKLLRFDAKNEARLIMEKLNPLPEFTTRSQLQMFIWELLQVRSIVSNKESRL